MKCIIFDFDGTILSSKEIAKKAMDRAVQELNIKRCNISLYNKPLFYPELLVKIIGIEENLSVQEEENLLSAYKKYLKNEEGKAQIDEAIVRAINIFKNEEVLLAIYSDRKTENLVSLLKKLDLKNSFSIICGRDLMQPKPSTEFIDYLSEKYDIRKSDILFIGDTDVDYLVAKKSGIYYAHAKYSNELSNESWKYCDKMLEKPTEIEILIKDFLQHGVKNESRTC